MWGSGSSRQTITGGFSYKGREDNFYNLNFRVSISSVSKADMAVKAAISGRYSPDAACRMSVPSLVV